MRQWLNTLRPREVVLAAVTVLVATSAWGMSDLIFPAYDRFAAQRDLNRTHRDEYAQLTANLAIRRQVQQAFATLAEDIQQTATDQIAMSRFLRDLERTLKRHPKITMINARPLPIESGRNLKAYRVRLSVTARLQDLLRFVAELTGGPDVVGLEAFSLRGVQRSNCVEAVLSLQRIRFSPAKPEDSAESVRSSDLREHVHGQ